MNARKLFDKPKTKRKKLKIKKSLKRYRFTNDQIYTLSDEELERIMRIGTPEEKDAARGAISKRKMTRLVTYGY